MKTSKEKKETQKQKVLSLAQEHILFNVGKLLPYFPNVPKNSIEKVVMSLEKDDLISKTKSKVKGAYGYNETLYTIL